MRLSTWAQVVLLTALVLMVGCGKPQKPSAAGEVTGYVCSTCKGKFYVEQPIVADFCPQCKGTVLQCRVTFTARAKEGRKGGRLNEIARIGWRWSWNSGWLWHVIMPFGSGHGRIAGRGSSARSDRKSVV